MSRKVSRLLPLFFMIIALIVLVAPTDILMAASAGALDLNAATGSQSVPGVRVSGTMSVGPTGDYASLTAAFADINANGLDGPVILELQPSYISTVESFPLTPGRLLNNSSVNTVTVRPALGATDLSITSANSTATFNIDGGSYGCSNLIVDGRPGGVGSTKHLTIENTGTGPALRFINEASNNLIMWVTLQAVTTATDSGVVVFSTTTGSNGNDNNIIDHCDIRDGATTPRFGVYSQGTTEEYSNEPNNSGNVISNCNIYNFFVSNGVDAGIYLAEGTRDWTISGNSLFQQESRIATATATRYGLYLQGTDYDVSNNTIGGSTATAGGDPWTMSGEYDNRYVGIRAWASSIQGNTITNFNWYATGTEAETEIWIGIYGSGLDEESGTITGNTIGAETGTGSIVVTHNTSGKNTIGIVGGSNTIANNKIGSISVLGATSLISHNFTGIYAGSNMIANNVIGSLTTPDSIYAGVSTHTTSQVVSGIVNAGGFSTISGNTIANMTNDYNGIGSWGQVRGIATAGGIITDNIVRDLKTTSLNSLGTNQYSSVVGISLAANSNGHIVSGNIVHSLSNTVTTNNGVKVVGIYFATDLGISCVVSHNFVHSLSLSSTSTASYIYGIWVYSGTSAIYNNMVRIGIDSSGNSVGRNCSIRGIYEQNGTNDFSFNTVYVGGLVATTSSINTYAFYSLITMNQIRAHVNNVFVNARTKGAGTARHVAAYIAGTLPNPAGLTNDYNLYIASGNGAALIHNFTTYYTSLPVWRNASGLDDHSMASSTESVANFVDTGGNSETVDLHVQNPTAIEGVGIDIAYVTDDYDGQLRSVLTPVDIGADASDFIGRDIDLPTIDYNVLSDTITLDNPTLSDVVIADASGVNTASGTKPRLYYKRSTDTNTWNDNTSGTAGWKFVEASGSSSPFTFTIDYANLLGGTISYGTTIQYFIVAQDLSIIPNVGIKSGEFAAVPASVALTAAAFPIGSTIFSYSVYPPISGIKTVCASGCDYTTLTGPGGAFSSINAACATSNLELQIAGDLITGETGANALNAIRETPAGSGFTLKMYPVGEPRAITSTTTPTGGFIRLNGADNITIDGSLGGNGTDRSLTITQKNTGASNVVIWLHYVASTTDGATGNTIQNLNIVGNSNTTTLFGIGMGSSSTPGVSNYGRNNNYNTIRNNAISRVKYGIYTKGLNATTMNTGNVITLNMLNAESPNNIAIGGILVGYEDAIEISRNVISGMSMAASADVFGISLGLTAIGSTLFSGHMVSNASVTKNSIGSVNSSGTISAVGIAVAASTSGTILIANNSISGVSSTTTSATTDFAAGIVLGGGAAVTKVYYNSVSMTGTLAGGASPSYALAMGGTSPVPIVDVRNNILYNTQVHGTGLSLAIGMQTGTFTNLVSDYNDLYVGSGDYFYLGRTGGLPQASGVNRTDLVAWQTATGKDTHSISADPLFTSTSDLLPGSLSPAKHAATPVEVLDDINDNPRDVIEPSIGAYEIGDDIDGPVIDYVPFEDISALTDRTLVVTVVDSAGVPTSGIGLPVLYFRKGTAGSYVSTQCVYQSGDTYDCTTDYSLLGGVDYGDVIQYYVVAQDTMDNVGVRPESGAGDFTANPPAAGTPPTVPDSYVTAIVLSGSYDVGSGQTYTSLTNPDGIFDAINRSVLGGDVTINITSDLTAETGSIGLNPFSETGVGGYILTIKPTGASRVIQGTGTNDAVIRLLGADRVVIDGSLSGGTDRSLTIDNPNSTDTGAVVILIGSLGPGEGAENVTVKNCIIEGGTIGSASITTFGIHVGSSVGGYEGDDNDNLTILNNQIIGATIGIQAYGTTSGTLDGLVITGNLLGDVSSPASLGQIGLSLGACNNATVSDNTIMNVSCGFNNAYGIVLGSGFAQSVVSRNFISGISYTGTAGYGGVGIHVNTGATAENIIIANNMVSGMEGDGSITTDRSICGIHLDGTSTGVKVLFNSVNLGSGPYAGYDAATLSGALIIESTVTNSDIRNNVLVSNLVNTTNAGAKTYAILSKTDYLGFSFIDNNDYHVSDSQGVLGSLNATDLTTLDAWRAATQQDPLSLSVAPSFVSATDLHLETGVATWLESSGVGIISVPDDFDAETRHATRPDIGADEGTFPPVLDMGVTSVDVPTLGGSIIAGTPFTPTATFTNYGRLDMTDVVVRFRIVGPAPSAADVYNQTLTIGSLAILAPTQRSFPSTTIYFGRAYTIYVTTEASGDMVPENDEISGNLTVLPTIDLESTAVNDPLSGSTKTAGISFIPAAVFHNGGLVTLNDAPVRFRIVGPSPQVTEVYNQTAVIPTIAVDEYLQVEFPAVSESAFPIAGTWTAYALSEQSGDEQPNNDQVSATFSVNVVGTVGSNPADHLRLTKNTGTPLTVNLTWGASCGTAATDYAIYEGTMGTWYSHASTVCSTSGGLSSLNYTPDTGDSYFLIVPLSTSLEGSYGQRSDGVERPVGTGACIATQNTAACEGAKARRASNPEATAPVEDDLANLRYWDEANAYGGYRLLTAGRTSVLLDREGNAVKSWPEANATRTIHGGTTLTRFPDEESGFSGFREIDENGSVIREYLETRPDYHLHGDFIRIFNRKLNDYTLLYLAARDLTPGQSIAAGCNPDGRACDRAQAATIVEVDSFGQIVWEWSFIDHIDLPVRSTHTGHAVSKGPTDRFSGRLDMSDPRLTLGRGWPTSTFLFYNEELGHIVVNSALEEFHVIDHAASFIVGDPEGSIKRAASPAGDFIHRFPDTTRH